MQHDTFAAPVTVLVGFGVPVEVTSARQAYELMADWPTSQRRCGHNTYMAACRIVMNGGGYAYQAREALFSFAEEAGVLVHSEAAHLHAHAAAPESASITARW